MVDLIYGCVHENFMRGLWELHERTRTRGRRGSRGGKVKNDRRRKKLKKSKGKRSKILRRGGSKGRGDHERIMRRLWENHENIDGSESQKKKDWLQTCIRLMYTNPSTTFLVNINSSPHLYSKLSQEKEAHELYEQGADQHFMNGWCANHSGRRICEKWLMHACGLVAKIYARPVGFFFVLCAPAVRTIRAQ